MPAHPPSTQPPTPMEDKAFTALMLPGTRPNVGHLLTLEQILCRDRPYVRAIPPATASRRFMLTLPARRRSFYDIALPVPWPPHHPDRRPKVLQSLIYEERLRDIMHSITRTTYSFKAKYACLARPQDMYTCCPRKGF